MCPSACGPLWKPGVDLENVTCPCGLGYFDRSGWFVAGDRIRSGSAPSREASGGHERSCPVRVDPRNRDEASSALRGANETLRDYFMPAEDIDNEVLNIYVGRDGPQASAKPATFHGKSGYLIHAKQMPTVEFISNLKADSARVRKQRQTYGRSMPNWAPPGFTSEDPSRQDGQQIFGHSVSSSGGRRSGDRSQTQYSIAVSRKPEYEQTYSRENQQPSIRDVRDPYRTTAYVDTASWRAHEQISDNLPTDPRAGFQRSEAPSSQRVSTSDRRETKRTTEAEAAFTGSIYAASSELRRASTLTMRDSRLASSQNVQREHESRHERSTSGYDERDSRRGITYRDPRDGRTVINSNARRAYTDPRDQHTPSTFSRTDRGSVDPDDYEDEDEEPTNQSPRREYRRR